MYLGRINLEGVQLALWLLCNSNCFCSGLRFVIQPRIWLGYSAILYLLYVHLDRIRNSLSTISSIQKLTAC